MLRGMGKTAIWGRAAREGRTEVELIWLRWRALRGGGIEKRSSGFDDLLTKPIAFEKIGDLLRRLSLEKGGGVGE